MIKISRLTDYAVLVLLELDSKARNLSAAQISRQTSIPVPTVAKVAKILNQSGLIESKRGAEGGYNLSTDIEDISVGHVIEIFDGPLALTSCVGAGDDSCALEASCAMAGKWASLNNQIRHLLYNTSLRDMIAQPKGPSNLSAPAGYNQREESVRS